MRSLFTITIVLSLVLRASAALAEQDVCGPAPQLPTVLQSDDTLKAQLEGEARSLLGAAGKAALGGQIESARKRLYQNSGDFFAAQKDAYLAYVFCQLITKDNSLSTTAKIRAIREFSRPLETGQTSNQVASPEAPAASNRKLVFENSYLRVSIKQASSNKVVGFSPISYNNSISIELENTSTQSYGIATAYNRPKSISIVGSRGNCEDPEVSGIGEVAYWNGQILTGLPTTLEPGDRLIMNATFFGCLTGFSGSRAAFAARLMRFTHPGLQSVTVSMNDIYFE
jgi:hypothetical protein